MFSLKDKIALVTGASQGIGRDTALTLAQAGAKVAVAARNEEKLATLVSEIEAAGGAALAVKMDVADAEQVKAGFKQVIEKFGKLDILVNNAGILIRKGIEETTEDDWDRIMAVNVKGVFMGTKYALPALRQAGGGSIINISSTAGLVGSPYGSAAYTATKGAVRLFTKATATQHAKDKIRCNSVHPGPIDTEMMRDVLGDPTLREERLQRIPLGRAGKAEDVAYGVLYLASEEASFVTGSELVIDGGSTAQ